MFFIVILRAILRKGLQKKKDKKIGLNPLNLIQAKNLMTNQEWVLRHVETLKYVDMYVGKNMNNSLLPKLKHKMPKTK